VTASIAQINTGVAALAAAIRESRPSMAGVAEIAGAK
jgi:hypothetical protein